MMEKEEQQEDDLTGPVWTQSSFLVSERSGHTCNYFPKRYEKYS